MFGETSLDLSSLPRPLTSFIGREAELTELKTLLIGGPLLTLTGPGGCGKTRLALEVATTLAPTFGDGVWWTDLGDLSDPALVSQAVALAVGVREQPGQPLLTTLIDHIKSREALLVLDNCEHVVEACAYLAEALLQACPALFMLATSREALGAVGEIVWTAPPLPLPEAERLFVERAQAVVPSFHLTPNHQTAVTHICRRLDGIPLAIELAAARVKVLSVEQIARRLDDVFRLLIGSDRSAAPRHQTLHAAIAWSYELLSPPERALFRRLSMFVGGFTLEAAEETATGLRWEEKPSLNHLSSIINLDVLDLLSRLVDKSLVIAEPGPNAVRYRMLETLRQFAADRLAETDEGAAVAYQHALFYLKLVEEAEPNLTQPTREEWLTRLETENDNLRAALSWSLAAHPGLTLEPSPSEISLRLASGLVIFWNARNYLTEGLGWLQAAVKADNDRRVIQTGQAINASSNSPALTQARAKTLTGLGIMARLCGEHIVGRTALESAVDLWRSLDNRRGLANALAGLGRIVLDQGDYVTGRALATESLTLYRALGDKAGEATAMFGLATSMLGAGDYRVAAELFETIRQTWTRLGNWQSVAVALNSLGEVARVEGRYDDAVAYYQQALELCERLNDPWRHAMAQHNLAYAFQHQGHLDQAATLFRASLSRWRRVGNRRGVAMCLAGLAADAQLRGDLDRAARLLSASATLLETMQSLLDKSDRLEYEYHLTQVHTRLDAVLFEARWAEGRRLTVDEAVTLALSESAAVRPSTADDRRWTMDDGRWTMDDGQPTADGRPEAGTPTADREIRNPKYALRTTQPEIRNPKYEIRILALGRPEVYCEDRLLTQSDWAVAKARELLFYLLAHPPRTRDQIGQALWPDATPAQWSANCRTTLHRLRRALGHADWILFQDDRYSFNRDRSYFYDVDAFERLVKTALSSPDPGILAQAVALYRGAYLEDMAGGDWIEQRREAYHQQAVTARLMLGRALLETQHTTEAVEQYRALLRQDNYLEEAHRELMRAYARLGEVGQALEHYQSLVNLFKTELGTSPDPATQALAQRLRRGDPV